MGILDGKRILVAGVTMDSSIGFSVAKVAQEQGATVLISNFGRALGITRRIAKRLPTEPPVLELDVTDESHLEGLADAVREHVDGLDGVVHSIAFGNPEHPARREVPAGPLARRRAGGAGVGVLAQGPGDGLPAADGPGRLDRRDDLRRHRRLAGVRLDGRGEGRRSSPPRATWPATWVREGIRCNLVSAGPLKSLAAKAIPGFEQLESLWSDRAPLGWDEKDQEPTARAVCALLSDFFPATTGEIIHVDGGFHAMGA